jgi:hypothetical protein
MGGSRELPKQLRGLTADKPYVNKKGNLVPGTQRAETEFLEANGYTVLEGSKFSKHRKSRGELLQEGKLVELATDPLLLKAFHFRLSVATNEAPHTATPEMRALLRKMAAAFTKQFPGKHLTITSSYRNREEQKHAGRNAAKGNDSAHSYGCAVDIAKPPGETNPQRI